MLYKVLTKDIIGDAKATNPGSWSAFQGGLHLAMCECVYTYIYIYIYRERERD